MRPARKSKSIGRYVAFTSSASNLVTDDTGFGSSASDLVRHDTNGNVGDVFVRNLSNGRTILVTRSSSGGSGNGSSGRGVPSGNGSRVLFSSEATDLGVDPGDGRAHLFVSTRQTSGASASGPGGGCVGVTWQFTQPGSAVRSSGNRLSRPGNYRDRMHLLRRRWVWFAGGPLVLLVVAVVVLTYAYPSVAATTCPRCFSMEELRSGLYVEGGLTAAQRDRMISVQDQAAQRVASFYGGRESDPLLLACFTDDCYRRIGGGGERGVAVLNRAVMLSPRGLDPVIASHEMSHVEFHERLGDRAAGVPQWFDEGLAVIVSADERNIRPSGAGDRCKVEPTGELPVTLGEWLAAATADDQMYAKAACAVSRWLDTHDGRKGVLDLASTGWRG